MGKKVLTVSVDEECIDILQHYRDTVPKFTISGFVSKLIVDQHLIDIETKHALNTDKDKKFEEQSVDNLIGVSSGAVSND